MRKFQNVKCHFDGVWEGRGGKEGRNEKEIDQKREGRMCKRNRRLKRIWIWVLILILIEMVVIGNIGEEEKYSKLDEVDRELHTLGDHLENISHGKMGEREEERERIESREREEGRNSGCGDKFLH
jgi:hypothetical protein